MAHSAKRTIDHEEIRRWVEAHGGCPSHVKRTSDGGDPGILRIDFPGFGGQQSLESIGWDEWFEWFEKDELAFLYQDEKDSRFNKLVRRNADEAREGEEQHERAGGQSHGSGAHGMQGSRPQRWSSKTERVTINDATEEELDALWGVGPANARRILDYRRKHGRIKGRDDLVAIDGIDGALADVIAKQADFG